MRSYTRAEKVSRARHVLKGVRQAAADCDTSRQDAAIDRIDERAEERGYLELSSMHAELEAAKQGVAKSKTTLRIAAREDRRAAKDALKQAERDLRRVENAARKIGL